MGIRDQLHAQYSGSASPLTDYRHDIRSAYKSGTFLLGLKQLAAHMDSAEKDHSSTTPSKSQIKRVRDWVNSQCTIYPQSLLSAA